MPKPVIGLVQGASFGGLLVALIFDRMKGAMHEVRNVRSLIVSFVGPASGQLLRAIFSGEETFKTKKEIFTEGRLETLAKIPTGNLAKQVI